MLIRLAKEYKSLLNLKTEERELDDCMVPDDFFQTLLQYTFERQYLDTLHLTKAFPNAQEEIRNTAWAKINRLPIHPSKIDEYNLLPRWQSTLSTIHLLGHRLIFMLLRHEGSTGIYLGTAPNGLTNTKASGNQLCQSIYGQMPGTEIKILGQSEVVDEIGMPIMGLNACGAVTGIPSPRKTQSFELLQTLDQLAFGIRDNSGYDHDYAMIVIADPVPDIEIAGLTGTILNIGTEIHDKIQQSVSETSGENINSGSSVNLGSIVSALFSMVPGAKLLAAGFAGARLLGFGASAAAGVANGIQAATGGISGLLGGGLSKGITSTYSKNVSRQYMSKVGEYCERTIDKYVERMERGRNLGFWNTGVYVLGDVETTVNTVMGMLRSVYSGEDTYLEPIRGHLFNENSGASRYIKQFSHIPFPNEAQEAKKYREITGKTGWNPLGPLYEYVTTPINTEELSIATSLPRRDVPGLRFVRNAVRFAANPPKPKENSDSVVIGQVMDTGVTLSSRYSFDVNSLTKHALVTGITGSGKSTTCRALIKAAEDRKTPFMVIEPAKEEYVAWAIEQNKHLPKEEQIHIYMPGASCNKENFEKLFLNPFEQAVADGGTLNMMSHLEKFKSAFMASLPMGDVLPLLVEESLYELINIKMGPVYLREEKPMNPDIIFPVIADLPAVADRMIAARGYDKEIQSNLKAAIRTRINALTSGWKGDIFNSPYSTPYKDLFDRKVIINLNRVSDDRDKSLIMSLLLISLCEYRESKYRTDEKYKEKADHNMLCHFAIIEEAHRLLKNPGPASEGSGSPQAVVSNMFSEMLSEIRAYGQGILIVDQVPSRLIPDAIKNTNLKIVHRIVAKDDRQAMSGCMGLREDQEDTIAILPPGQAIICGDNDDAASWVKVNLS